MDKRDWRELFRLLLQGLALLIVGGLIYAVLAYFVPRARVLIGL